MKYSSDKYKFLDFANIPFETKLYKIITNSINTGYVGEGFSKIGKFLPYTHRKVIVPTDYYDGMIFVYKATPIKIKY